MASNVITDIESKNKATKHLSLSNLFFVVFYMLFAYMLKDMVSGALFIPYMIFDFVCAFWLIIPSGYNKGRTHLESISVWLKKDANVYRPYMGGDRDE